MRKNGEHSKGKDQGCPFAKDLRTPKYKQRVVPDKVKQQSKTKCRGNKGEHKYACC